MEAGDELTEGSVNPHDILKIKGVRAVQDYMLQEVQRVYRLQGVEINDKHIEVIVRQMLKKIRIEENGDTDFLPGTMVDVLEFEDVNEELDSRRQRAGRRKAGHAWYHKGFPCNEFLPLRSILPGNNEGTDRGGNQRKDAIRSSV